jgi:hypothetical protein
VGPTPVLSRSSSRKNEQSPYRRNPMAELDENSLRGVRSTSHRARERRRLHAETLRPTAKKKQTVGPI